MRSIYDSSVNQFVFGPNENALPFTRAVPVQVVHVVLDERAISPDVGQSTERVVGMLIRPVSRAAVPPWQPRAGTGAAAVSLHQLRAAGLERRMRGCRDGLAALRDLTLQPAEQRARDLGAPDDPDSA